MKTKTEELKKEFEKKFMGVGFASTEYPNGQQIGRGYMFTPQVDELWLWFESKLSSSRQEMVGGLEKMKTKKTNGGYLDCGGHNGLNECCRNQTIDEILASLKQDRERMMK